jgi:hypothetical protein
MRLLCSLLVVLCLMLVGSDLRAQPPTDEPPTETESTPEGAANPAYERHMDNGVKLYGEGNYPAAIAEFEAAYAAHPNASPLINLALSYKKQFAYQRAIAVLELALKKHQDTIKPEHKEAAEKEIRELKALLAWVEVKVTPKNAELLVDGKLQTAGKIALSPGEHRFSAKADGYKAAEVRSTLTSGEQNDPVVLKLELNAGELSIGTLSKDTTIEIDGTQVGKANWKGLLPPGVHKVRVISDDEVFVVNVFIKAGGKHTVQQLEDGSLKTNAPAKLGDGNKDDPDEPEEEDLSGFYFTATAAILTAVFQSDTFVRGSGAQWGGAGGLHIGYRVADFAGFELIGQFSDIRLKGTVEDEAANLKVENGKMRLSSGRVGGLFRVMIPGRSFIRFVGTLGGGVLIEELEWDNLFEDTFGQRYEDQKGVGGFAQLDLGAEVELKNVLLGLYVQQTGQTTKHFDTSNDQNAFDEGVILVIGPQIRVGYSLW